MIIQRHINILLILGFFFLSNCATKDSSHLGNNYKNSIVPKQGSHDIESLISEINKEMRLKTVPNDINNTVNVDEDEQKANIPLEVNERVAYWIKYFSQNDRDRFQRFLNRGTKYRELITNILEEREIPSELYYLAMIESGFVINATSSAKANGIWQFMPATGRRYHLIVDNYVDERRDPIKATYAAASYLKDLHNVFHSWYLAMAAYNAGETRIMNSIMRHSSRNFWELAQKKALPKETMDYVPKFIAAAIIGHHPEKFGFEIEKEDAYPKLVTATVPSPISLSKVSTIIGISHADLKKYNPAVKKDTTSPQKNTYQLWVPERYQSKIASNYNKLQNVRIKNIPRQLASTTKATSKNSSSSTKYGFHKVRAGETLSSISIKYNLKLDYLMKINNLKTNKLYAGKILKVPQGQSNTPAKQYVRYKVKKGDNLHKIAQKNNISINQLKKENNLKGSQIFVGQALVIPKG